jgi:hypothetical protein
LQQTCSWGHLLAGCLCLGTMDGQNFHKPVCCRE